MDAVASPAPHIYRRRRPETTDLYKAVNENLEPFYDAYDHRFLDQHGPLPSAARSTIEAYLRCGCLWAGAARAKCDDCHREILVALSCQCRGVCPSCQQKRAEILCRFLEDEVVEPVDHRQLVFVLPKLFRAIFHRDRDMLTGLCRAAVDATVQFYRTGLDRKDVKPGLVVVPQFFGDRVNVHPHLHLLSTDGAFDPTGTFHPLPFDNQSDIAVLQRLFERNVLELLVTHGRLSERLRDDMLTWQHTGFSVDGSVKIYKDDREGLRRLVRYMARPAVSVERVSYDARQGRVTVRSAKKFNGQRPVVETYDALTFVSLLALQVPPTGTHLVRYYGWYSVRSRAQRRPKDAAQLAKPQCNEASPLGASERRRAWARLIRQVFEVDPLTCPGCRGRMRVVSFVTRAQPKVLEKILDHVGEPSRPERCTGPPKWIQVLDAQQRMLEHPERFPEDCADWQWDQRSPDEWN